jgi:hypothetical protein
MKEPKVVLKNVKTFNGHDGTGLNADVWINGINCMHVFDGAYGGEFEYTENIYNNPNAEQVKKNIEMLNEYVNQLPEQETQFGDKKVMLKMNLDMYIDDILVKQETEKAKKKFEKQKQKLMQTAILLGNPDETGYQYINLKRPLSDFPKGILQTHLNTIVLTHCKKGVKVLNTNLEQLGVEVRY